MGLITEVVKVKWNPKNKKHYEKLGYVYTKWGEEFDVKIEDLSGGSEIKVQCICDNCGIEFPVIYKNYNRYKKGEKYYCNKCSNDLWGRKKQIGTRINQSKSFEQWCIENNKQDILDRWDYELNDCSPKEVLFGSHNQYWFKCLNSISHHSELKKINSLTGDKQRNINCTQCNSIAQWFIDNNLRIEDYWDYDKNTEDPWSINRGSQKKIWIKCQEKDYHDTYIVRCNDFINGGRCPLCCNHNGRVHPLDSIGQYIINNYGEDFLWRVWSDKNKITPFEVAPKSNKKVWWKCLDGKHGEYKRECSNSYKYNFRCPKCIEEKEESIYEEKTRLYLEELGYKVYTEYDCSLIFKNPRTDRFLPFDNEIVLKNGKHLIIEVHGEQHYKLLSKNHRYFKEGQTPEEYLHQRKLYDRYKRIKCIQAGYYYLELSYINFIEEEYKTIIINLIKMLDK